MPNTPLSHTMPYYQRIANIIARAQNHVNTISEKFYEKKNFIQFVRKSGLKSPKKA